MLGLKGKHCPPPRWPLSEDSQFGWNLWAQPLSAKKLPPKEPPHASTKAVRLRQCWEQFVSGSCGPGKMTEKGKFSKVLRGGSAKGLLDRGSTKPLAPVQPHFALVQKQLWVVQKTFRRPLLPGSKRPIAPSPKHFWEFSLFGQFPRPTASQNLPQKLSCLLSRKLVCIFSCNLPGDLALNNGGDFW